MKVKEEKYKINIGIHRFWDKWILEYIHYSTFECFLWPSYITPGCVTEEFQVTLTKRHLMGKGQVAYIEWELI